MKAQQHSNSKSGREYKIKVLEEIARSKIARMRLPDANNTAGDVSKKGFGSKCQGIERWVLCLG